MKNIIVTGGSTGIGYELVKLFSAHCSWNVVTCSRNESQNQMLGSLIDCTKAFTVDLGSPSDRIKFASDFLNTHDSLGALVLNAAVTGIQAVDSQAYSTEYVEEVNVKSNIYLLETLLPYLRKSKGVVIFVSTGIFQESDRDPIIDLYAKTKKEFEEYFLNSAQRQDNLGVKFVVFRPGITATRLHRNIFKIGTGKLFERTKAAVNGKLLRNPYVVALAIKDLIDHPEKVGETIQVLTEEKYKNYLLKD